MPESEEGQTPHAEKSAQEQKALVQRQKPGDSQSGQVTVLEAVQSVKVPWVATLGRV